MLMYTKQKQYLEFLKEQVGVRIPLKHPGLLEVPKGRDIQDLPISHFQKLIKKHSWPSISKALINLKVWNQEKNPKLTKWADDTQEKLAKWVDKEREDKKNPDLYEKSTT